MGTKSFVSMDTKVCPICGNKHEVGLILDRRMKDSLEMQTVTGYALCTDCKDKVSEGYVALIECTNKPVNGSTLKTEEADRTGTVAWVKRDAFGELFNCIAPEHSIGFVPPEVIEFLNSIKQED